MKMSATSKRRFGVAFGAIFFLFVEAASGLYSLPLNERLLYQWDLVMNDL
jgi:hypothetical protein